MNCAHPALVHRLLWARPSFATMSHSESKAVFRARAVQMGSDDATIDAVINAGFTTMGRFAYSCSYTPGAADEAPFTALLTSIFPNVAVGQEVKAILRRLFFESYTIAAGELRQQLERTEETPPRRLAPADRASRYSAQVTSLPGLKLRGPLECADGLIDHGCQMYDDNRLRWIDWAICSAKEQEVNGIKRDPQLQFDSTGVVRIKSSSEIPVAELGTELRIKYALQRRGLAMEQSPFLGFMIHEQWADLLMEKRLAIPPPGFLPSQLLR